MDRRKRGHTHLHAVLQEFGTHAAFLRDLHAIRQQPAHHLQPADVVGGDLRREFGQRPRNALVTPRNQQSLRTRPEMQVGGFLFLCEAQQSQQNLADVTGGIRVRACESLGQLRFDDPHRSSVS